MKVDFRTIEIEKLVFSYLGILLLFLGLQYLIHFDPYYLVFVFPTMIPLYIIFSGKVLIDISKNSLSINWIKKPYLTPKEPMTIDFSEIIRWKYQKGNRGPDQLTIILHSGKKINFRPSIFNKEDLKFKVVKKLGEKIEEYNSKTSKDLLVRKLEKSGYIGILNDEIKKIKVGMIIIGLLGSLTLFIGAMDNTYKNANWIWIFFLSLFCAFFLLVLRYHYLKGEKTDTLRLE